MRSLQFAFGIFAIVVSTGCSNPFGGSESVVDADHHPGQTGGQNATPPSRGSDFISTSSQNVATQGGHFRFNASLGTATKAPVVTTTSGRYKMYLNVQGQLLSQ